MATMIPNKPLSTAPMAVQAMFRLLKKLDDSYTVWTRLSGGGGPAFLVLWRERHAFLIKVAETSQQLAETALQPSFLPDERIPVDELGDATAFRAALGDDGDSEVRCLVVFPNVDAGTIDEVERLRSEESGVVFLGLKQRNPADFQRRIEALAGGQVGKTVLYRLRERFTPESVIASSPTRVPLARRGDGGALPTAFLDLPQEALAKLEVELPRELEREARRFETRLVTGPAGCGKSLVLLHRAFLVSKLNSKARVLALTHNRPINAELDRRLRLTAGGATAIEWRTFFGWAHSQSRNWPDDVLSAWTVERRIAQLMRGSDWGRLTPRFVTEEIGYLRDLGVDSLEDYQKLERTGRVMALTAAAREKIWDILERHRAEMQCRNESDWHEQALRFRNHARNHPEDMPGYDFIFIDEAQFFAKVWFEPVLASLRPGGQLFLAADPTQGFLKRRESWAAAGIEVRGRSSRLGRPYRSTRAILSFARDLVERRRALHPGSTDDLDPPNDDELAATDQTGETPVLLPLRGLEAIRRVVQEVADLRQQSPHLAGSVLLLHADSLATRGLADALRQRLGASAVADLDDRNDRGTTPFCSVSRLTSATGLEAAVVFLLGVDNLLESEGDPRLDEAARAELAADHTRLLYMGCTRAARRLVIFSQKWAS